MKFGIEIVPLGDFGDPRVVVSLARTAEAAGWEGLFVWDHLAYVWDVPGADPWVVLAAVAVATARLRLGAMVTPLARRRPQVLAQTVATLDLLSDGRLIFGAGLGGVETEYTAFGEDADPRRRATFLDEGLDILSRWWAGERVRHHSDAYDIDEVALVPLPLQRPRPPIWIGGESGPALRRAARWDGWVIGGADENAQMIKTPAQLAAQIAAIRRQRTTDTPLAVAMTGVTEPGDADRPAAYAAAGLTWWLESIHGMRGSVAEMTARIAAGPPR